MFIKTLPKEIKLQAKQKQHSKFDITNKNDIAELTQSFKDIQTKYPIVMSFLESYCGYDSALLSFDPQEICYSQGKRDVILTIKTMMRDDLSPDIIAQYYKRSI